MALVKVYNKLIMLNTFIYTIFIFLSFISHSQEIITPNGYSVLKEIEGDLNKDSIPEKAIVYNTSDSSDFGFIREIQIFKNVNQKWILLEKSRNAILKSEEGGILGDPFESIYIKKGVLIINHFGGSNSKWSKTDKYRFNVSTFELIGTKISNGMSCEYRETIDFNLLTGKIIYSKKFEKCSANKNTPKVYKTENETFQNNSIKLNLNNRFTEDYQIITPKTKQVIYL